MPVYTYRAVKSDAKEPRDCELCAQPFEIVQRMSDDSLTACPKCGEAIEKIVTAPNVPGPGSIAKPSDAQLARSGFTQYKKQGKGYYEKTFGSGPSTLHP